MRAPLAEMSLRARVAWAVIIALAGAVALALLDPVPFATAFPVRLGMMGLIVVFTGIAVASMSFFRRGRWLPGLAAATVCVGGLALLGYLA
jgi:hypothetical protein